VVWQFSNSNKRISSFNQFAVFPCIYWLCLELFSTRGMDGNGAGSRFIIHVVYAQEARSILCGQRLFCYQVCPATGNAAKHKI